MTVHVSVFEGEDAAPEAMQPTVELLKTLDLDVEFVTPPVDEYTDELAAGHLPSELSRTIDDSDAVLFGAARGDGDTYIRILSYLRSEYGGGLPANIRPIRYFEGATSPVVDPDGIDYAIVRENPPAGFSRNHGTEGELSELADVTSGVESEGILGRDFASLGDGTFSIQVTSERNVRQLASIACEFARDRFDHRPIRVTSATKSTALPRTHGLFDAIVEEVANGYDSMEYEHLQVDNAAHHQVSHPRHFDVVVAPNAEGDILADVGAATVGGLGLAPSGCYGEEVAYFEPVHGTAPDIAGEGIINPTAMILSAAMMLEYLGFDEDALRIENAVGRVYTEGTHLTPDQGGSASTTEMVDAVRRHL